MDWFSWLSKTSLDSSIVYEYSLAFSRNELEKEDISHFNHEFLQSMGITIAKHRLEILKLAKREKTHSFNLKQPMAKLLLLLKKTKNSLTNYISTLIHGEDSRALIILSNKNKFKRKNNKVGGGGGGGGAISYSSRWKKAMMINNNNNNNKKLMMVNQERLMLTNNGINNNFGEFDGGDDGDSMVVSIPKIESYSSTLMYDLQQSNKEEENMKIPDDQEGDDDDQQWTPVLEEINWDAMFQDLKPT